MTALADAVVACALACAGAAALACLMAFLTTHGHFKRWAAVLCAAAVLTLGIASIAVGLCIGTLIYIALG